jgi:Co/Zn/Cd efflux system component
MAGCCHEHHTISADLLDGRKWRTVLWIALILNAGMFLTEVVAGLAAGSVALQADALDFLSDAATYAISLGVAGLALTWRARAALLKGIALVVLGAWIAGSTVWHVYFGGLPAAHVMSIIGVLALLTNGGVALMLYRFRTGDANMRSVWICSRNDAIGNVAVLFAAAGVFGTGAAWPDLAVAAIMSGLSLWGGVQIVTHALTELNGERLKMAAAG